MIQWDDLDMSYLLNNLAFANTQYVFTQFTGLKDKNNREIYEGDILRIQIEDNPEDLRWELIEVEFKSGCFWIDGGFVQPLYEITVAGLVDGEVVGNVFETPELVK